MSNGEIDYALVRLRCRLALCPTLEEWTRIRRIRALETAWGALRQSGASAWMQSLSPDLRLPELEANLLSNWRMQMAQIAGWLPSTWQGALDRCAQTPPLIAGAELPSRWPAGLAGVLPSMETDERLAASRLYAQIGAHARAFSSAPPGNGWPIRESLQRDLQSSITRDPLSMVNVLRGVLVLSLDFERLRGELVRRTALRERAA